MKVGQGILGKITFKDGEEPAYSRPYLVVDVDDEDVSVLNVSSLEGKEWKLAYKTNFQIKQFSPPFRKPSFVKLDSLTKISKDECQKMRVLDGGRSLNEKELEEIRKRLELGTH